MRINFNRVLVIIILFISSSLFSSTMEEAKRNLDLGYYVVSEYLYNDLLASGNSEEDVLVGLSSSLINQAKYNEVIELSEQYSSNNLLYTRNLAYAHFMQKNYQASFYYYEHILKEDNTSLLDTSGRGWSAYYLGKYSLAYEDFKVIDNSEERENYYDGIKFLSDSWKSNYSAAFVSFNNSKLNLDLNYGLYMYNYSFSLNYNQNMGNKSDREMIILKAKIKTGKLSFDFASMNASGDYTKLYDGWGLALKSNYLLMLKNFQSNFSLIGGYTYFESVSSQQVRADISFNNQSFGISSGISYLYLDYITPDYDQKNILYHGFVYYKIIPAITIYYRLNIGKSNFAYNEYLTAYDDYDIEKLTHSLGISTTFRSITLYLNYLNKDLKEDTFGTGVSYVF